MRALVEVDFLVLVLWLPVLVPELVSDPDWRLVLDVLSLFGAFVTELSDERVEEALEAVGEAVGEAVCCAVVSTAMLA